MKKQIKDPTTKEIKSFIEDRSYIRKGDLILDRAEYEDFLKTHCKFCSKETRENLRYFGEITCRECKNEMDPLDIYSALKKTGVCKWAATGRK